ncbi:MAG: methyltransferase [Papillibacter sp.]|jgi:hypothetical protein|nr:methyltransferase [Papillibacter sp.]
MFRKIPFVKRELEITETLPGWFNGPGFPVKNTPVTCRENTISLFYEKKPFWLPTGSEIRMIGPASYNDNLGRGMGKDIKDAFGIEWEWIPAVGGSIVRPGAPLMTDVNEWRDIIKFPDIDSWDWESDAQKLKIDGRFSCQVSLINGFLFERLISFMDFAPAAMALIDEDQQDAIKDLFQATTDFACKLVDKILEYWPMLDGFNIHDDWGAQKAPFFSKEIAYEFFVPYMKQLNDHIHSKGRFVTLHSCGHVDSRVECFIDAGFDSWDPQLMNDIHMLYEKYGDKIILGVFPDKFDPETTSEEEQRQRARDFVDEFGKPGKPCILSHYGSYALTPAFTEELYTYSRKHFLEIN